MKKISLIALLAAGLLCLTAVACTDADTTADDTSASTEATTQETTEAATEEDDENWGDKEDKTEAATAQAQTSADTQAATEAATAADTAAESTAETEGGTEAVTEGVTEAATEGETRYDYFAAEVLPDVTVEKSDYENITLELPAGLKITDEDVQTFLLQLRFERKTATNGTTQVTDQPLKQGDVAYIYYKGVLDGVEFEGGSNMDDEAPYGLGLGSGSFIPGFEEGLVGVVPNTTSKETPYELHVTFPENYGNAELDGKDVIFYVVIEYAVQYELPEYTRDFVENTLQWKSEMTHLTDASFLAEFEDYCREYLESRMESQVESAKTTAMWEHLTANIECKNLPATEVAYYKNTYMSEVKSAYDYYAQYYGEEFKKEYPTIGDFAIAYMGLEKDKDWEAQLEEQAVNMVKKDMIIHAIAELEDTDTVTQADFDAEVQYWVEYYSSYGVTAEEVIKEMGEDYLRECAFDTKMTELLMSGITFTFPEDAQADAGAGEDAGESAE